MTRACGWTAAAPAASEVVVAVALAAVETVVRAAAGGSSLVPPFGGWSFAFEADRAVDRAETGGVGSGVAAAGAGEPPTRLDRAPSMSVWFDRPQCADYPNF